MSSFKPDMSLIPADLQEQVLSIARQYDNQIMSTEHTAEAGGDMVRVSVKYPGTVTRVKFNCELKEENKALLEDLVVAATERAFKKLDLSYREITVKLAGEIKDLVNDYINKNSLEPNMQQDSNDDDDMFN